MLTVFNCGQGDAIMLESDSCVFNSQKPLYIDLGPSSFTCNINSPVIDLLITHSHDDHLCGKFNGSNFIVDTLYLPAYFPEIYKILNKLLKGQFIKIPTAFQRVELLCEGSTFGGCGHMEVLNPPLDPNKIFSKKYTSEVSLQEIELFLQDNGTSVNDILNQDTPFNNITYPEGYSGRTFVIIAINIIKKLTRNGNVTIEKAIKRFLEFDANKISVVFKYHEENVGLVYLMTGDADRSVFNRLINSKYCLKADVLKVPHHGSIKNLSKTILSKISPSVAIISHNNGKFGRARDTHPNTEVIDMLNKSGSAVYYTNDVIKNGVLTESAHSGPIANAAAVII
ncbi:ComEC/Rec2 family competence protein [Enterobacter vonholyi]|uniref:ComEC/Rec2 family competence protein n=1 Tax=Enterobacter vonholyi TaxID=2797505 RepID=UPI002665D356|nr:hypothetical protein [Enterobacter vonholyi]MDO2449475.1 hypothetical protein [Enterobacter vonholyi]